jgi:UDP-N-acetylglucosamine diphosphorylase/glucosamine-1-phosphate N-acetyltransferase
MAISLILFEDNGFVDLLPMVFWRPVFELPVGRKSVMDRMAQRLGLPLTGVWTRDWLATVAAQRCGAPANQAANGGTVLVNGRWLCGDSETFPDDPCVGVIEDEIAYIVCDDDLAKRLSWKDMLDAQRLRESLDGVERRPVGGELFRYPWEIVGDLSNLLEGDWKSTDAVIESEVEARMETQDHIHIGERTTVHPTAIINAEAGSIYISHDVRIGAYTVIDGPAYIGPGTHIHPYTWLHGGNAIGAVCRMAGELHGCVISAYTNKQHAGFLGHAYVGSWVNLGAGCSNSDLKNTYGKIKVPINGTDVDTGTQFFGAIIGDHAKLGINATIPSGAVIGLAASVASSGMLPKYLPSFSWVTQERIRAGDPLRLLDAACAVMARRDVDMTDDEVELFSDLGTRVGSFEQGH